MGLEQFSLDGSVAIITGASRGIGEAIAVEMAEAGASIVGVARSEDDLLKTASRIHESGGEASVSVGDVTDIADIESAFDKAEDEFGTVDILVNNAGINPYFGNAQELDIETWSNIQSVNTTGAFQAAREFARRFQGGEVTGSVINIASIGGVVALPYQTPYTASKHALVGMTKSLSSEWAPEIRVNAIAPGYVKTEFTKGVRDNQSIRSDILSQIPQERFADPAEIAGAAVYLASNAATYVTGEVHVVDGGYIVE